MNMPGTQSTIDIASPADLAGWRPWLRWLINEAIPPQCVRWIESDEQNGLFTTNPLRQPATDAPAVRLPRRFGGLAKVLAWHRGAIKWQLLYRMAWRIVQGETDLLAILSDDDVVTADRMAKAVRRDAHKMHAFVRFREIADERARDGRRFVSFHRPEHPIIRREADWFVKRFADMDWAILTPDGSAAWDGHSLVFGPPATADDLPRSDEAESLWLTYYANIFNASRVNRRAMLREMPKKYWSTMPESELIDDLIKQARSADRQDPSHPARQRSLSLKQLAEAAVHCRECELCEHATQTVFGSGPADAKLVLVGEQPGDQEDHQGEPFVGPAGELLDELLKQAGLVRASLYLTNAVKHFGFTQRGLQRMHRKPKVGDQLACRPWLEEELRRLEPQAIVCLGATAAQNVISRTFRLTKHLGETVTSPWASHTIATYHPAAILRSAARDPAASMTQQAQLVADLTRARTIIDSLAE